MSPNPFSGRTTIHFAPDRLEPVHIAVYNALGRRVATLTDGVKTGGNHEIAWNGKDDNGQSCNAGLYLCVIKTGDYTETHKLLLVR